MDHKERMKISQTLRDRLMRAIEVARQHVSSDFDLNAGGADMRRKTGLTPAAVLVGIRPGVDGPRMVLTKRTSALKHHPGQIAFPGGKQDPGDQDVRATALREAQEEIGLAARQVDVLGPLGRHETVTGFDVTPVLALIDADFVAVPEPGEVDTVFEVPLSFLMAPGNTRIEGRIWHGTRRRFYVMPYGPYYIWGATARMIVALRTAWDAT